MQTPSILRKLRSHFDLQSCPQVHLNLRKRELRYSQLEHCIKGNQQRSRRPSAIKKYFDLERKIGKPTREGGERTMGTRVKGFEIDFTGHEWTSLTAQFGPLVYKGQCLKTH